MNICNLVKKQQHLDKKAHELSISGRSSSVMPLFKKTFIQKATLNQTSKQKCSNDSFKFFSPSFAMINQSNTNNNHYKSASLTLEKPIKAYSLRYNDNIKSKNKNDSAYCSNYKKSLQKDNQAIKIKNNITVYKPKIKLGIDYFQSHYYKEIVKENNILKHKKKHLRGKFTYLLNHSNVYSHDMYKKYNALFHKKNFENLIKLKNKSISIIQKKRNGIHINHHPNLFANERVYYQYENNYVTPDTFLLNNFTKDELATIKASPRLFKLKEDPFLGANMKIDYTLKDILNAEDNKSLIKKEKVIKEDSWLYKTKDYLEYLEKRKEDKRKMNKKNHSCFLFKSQSEKKQREEYIEKRNKNVEIMIKSTRENSRIISHFYDKHFEKAKERKLFYLAIKARKIQNREFNISNRINRKLYRNSSEYDNSSNLKNVQNNIVQNYCHFTKHKTSQMLKSVRSSII